MYCLIQFTLPMLTLWPFTSVRINVNSAGISSPRMRNTISQGQDGCHQENTETDCCLHSETILLISIQSRREQIATGPKNKCSLCNTGNHTDTALARLLHGGFPASESLASCHKLVGLACPSKIYWVILNHCPWELEFLSYTELLHEIYWVILNHCPWELLSYIELLHESYLVSYTELLHDSYWVIACMTYTESLMLMRFTELY